MNDKKKKTKKRYYETPRECIDYFREEYEFLSNFYPTKMVFDGLTYYNSEAAYQAQKCNNQEDKLKFIFLSADESKKLGREAALRPDWDIIKVEIMEKVVYAKFTQNPFLAQALLETGDKELKEGNYWKDLFWGVDLKTGEGENHLGKILMALRREFRQNGIPKIENDSLHTYVSYGKIQVDDCDITLSDCECIVNAANETLLGGSGVDGAIHRAAGKELQEECKTLNGCKTGEAKITGGYRLKAHSVIHTVGPRYPSVSCQQYLAMCYTESLNLAKANDIHSIAFPSISTGKFSYPKKEACEIAVAAVKLWLEENAEYEMRVVFSCVDPTIYRLICENLN